MNGADGPAALRLERVSKHYGSGERAVVALDGVTLTVAAGEFVSVLGPSGSGKSTILNLAAALDRPTSGCVALDGQDVSRLSNDEISDIRLRRIGFVFQSFNLFPTFTAAENVAWPLTFLGVGWRKARGRAATLLEELGIDSDAHGRLPPDLSGGEQQRVALARALVTGPRLLLADEPTGNLDWRTAKEVLAILSRLNARRAMTVILVTHNMAAAAYGHRTVRLCHGRLIDDGGTAGDRARLRA